MRRRISLLLIIFALVPVGVAHGSEDPLREAAKEIARRRERIEGFHAVRENLAREEAERERLARERHQARAREAEEWERVRLEYVRSRPSRDTAEGEERRERLAREELERDERMRERWRHAFSLGRAQLRQELRSGAGIDEMLEYDLRTDRDNRAARDGK